MNRFDILLGKEVPEAALIKEKLRQDMEKFAEKTSVESLKKSIVGDFIRTSNSRSRLASAMTEPFILATNRDSISRRTFQIQNVGS